MGSDSAALGKRCVDRAGEGVYKLAGGVCTAEPGGDEKKSAVRDRAGTGFGEGIGLGFERGSEGEKGDAKKASVLLFALGFISGDWGKERSENVLERDEDGLVLKRGEDVLEEEEDFG